MFKFSASIVSTSLYGRLSPKENSINKFLLISFKKFSSVNDKDFLSFKNSFLFTSKDLIKIRILIRSQLSYNSLNCTLLSFEFWN